MDVLLARVTQQAMHYAIRSGISITTGYAIKQCGRLLKEAPRGREREELMHLQARLESKIRIVSPSIDMIELISARGNTSLDSAVSLTKDIRYDIQKLGHQLAQAANDEELLRRKSSRAKTREETNRGLSVIIAQIKLLLARIEDAVPLINLAITTSGVNLSTKLSGTISPSRLLQASTFLTTADSSFISEPSERQQVGPTYVLSMYMLFAGHASRPVDEGIREATWKEVIHKAKVKLWRVPLDQLYCRPGESGTGDAGTTIPAEAKAAEFAYQLVIIEDLDDDRVHTVEENESQPGPFDDVQKAGIRDVIPVHEVSKIFYADTGKILNIGGDSDTNSPVLLLKRDVHAEPPRRMLQRSQSRQSLYDGQTSNGLNSQAELDAQFERESNPGTPIKAKFDGNEQWRLPADLDPEWVAFEVYTEESDSESDNEQEAEPDRPSSSRSNSTDANLAKGLLQLDLRPSSARSSLGESTIPAQQNSSLQISPNKRFGPPIKTSLSLLEMLMKLAALQQFRQESHLAIEDELLNFFLEDSATAGAGADKAHRQRIRHDAQRRVGFDPYDESPIKRRSEEYIQHARHGSPQDSEPGSERFAGRSTYIESSEFNGEPIPRLDFRRDPTVWPDSRSGASYSPSPRSTPQHTPSRASTSGASNNSTPHYTSTSATPPNRSRQDFIRAQSEPKGRSPLGREIKSDSD